MKYKILIKIPEGESKKVISESYACPKTAPPSSDMTKDTRINSAGLANKANFINGAIHGYGTKPKIPINAVGQIMMRKNQIMTEIDNACHLVDTIHPTVIPMTRKKKIRLIEKK